MRTWLIALMLLMTYEAAAVEYRTAELKRLTSALGIDTKTFAEGDQIVSAKNIDVHVRLYQGVVTHVGRKLFADEMWLVSKPAILDFLERYFLSLQFPASGRPATHMLDEDHVKFVRGGIATIATINENDNFALSFSGNHYVVKWTRDDITVVEVNFPANHQLISGENKADAEKWLQMDVSQGVYANALPASPDEAMLKATAQKGYYIMKGNFYLTPQINDNLYFKKEGTGTYTLVNDENYLMESCANIMLQPTPGEGYTLNVSQNIYGLKQKNFTISLNKWISWCKSKDCELFFGVEEISDDVLRGCLIARNSTMGYNHMLNVKIPLTTVGQGRGDIEAKLYCFIPTDNITDLFDENNHPATPKLYIPE